MRRILEAELCRRSLAHFVRLAWNVVEPGNPIVWNWHIDVICEHLEAVTRGDILKLIINIPPGHMKSMLVSVFWPAWEWTIDPTIRSMYGSCDEQLAFRDSDKTRDLVTSEWYQQLFNPDWSIRVGQNAKSYWKNTKQGYRYSFQIGGKVVGWRGDKVVMDDPLQTKDQYNKAIKESVNWKWDKVLTTRVNDPQKARFVLIMQRLASDDLSGYLMEQGGYETLVLPSEFDPDRRASTSLGVQDPRTEEGQLLFPERFDRLTLDGYKYKTLGPTDFAGQHNQLPTPSEGGRFKKDWFRYYQVVSPGIFRLRHRDARGEELVNINHCWMFTTQDVANSLKTAADWTVICLWMVTPNKDLVLLERHRFRKQEPDVIHFMTDLFSSWVARNKPLAFALVEANGTGLPLCQNLQRAGLPVFPVSAIQDKFSRSTTAAVRCEAGQVFFPEAAEWLAEWEREITLFPNGEHDDQLDNLTWAAIAVFSNDATIMSVTPIDAKGSRPLFRQHEVTASESRDRTIHDHSGNGFGGSGSRQLYR